MTASPASLAVVQAYVDAWNKNDALTANTLFTPDAQLVIYPKHLNVYDCVGAEAILDFMSKSFKLIKERKAEIVDICAEETKVWAHVVGTATLVNGETWVPDTVYMFDLVRDNTGELKISKLTEMVDAVGVQKIVALTSS